MSAPEQLLRVREIAKHLGVSAAWVSIHARGARRPQLPSIKMGKLVRFRMSDVEEFVEECERMLLEKRA